ncbi:hypothetical protein BGZ83_011994 [Gryganskiella cystojenkinii]|nr:hypothetical protein BGZ83_011994 [Gryganskiella cystojenkinii]
MTSSHNATSYDVPSSLTPTCLKIKMNPIEIPELLHIIGCHLSEGDLKICMLVSRTWNNLFRAYFWYHLVFNRKGIPHLERYGHLVRSLESYSVTDQDMHIMAGACHNVKTLTLGLTRQEPLFAMDVLMSNLPFVTDLTFKVSYLFSIEHWVAISRLRQLRKLTLASSIPNGKTEGDFAMLLNVLQECPAIVSLNIHGMGNNVLRQPSRYTRRPQINGDHYTNTGALDPPPVENVVTRWIRKQLYPHQFNSNLPSPAVKAKEPWRKFVLDPTIGIPLKWNTPALLEGDNPRITSLPFPRLTKLHLIKVSASFAAHSPMGILFRKSPQIEDLHVNFSAMDAGATSECLNAITEGCPQIRILKIEGINPHYTVQTALYDFFRQDRRHLRDLTIKNCTGMEPWFKKIPDLTVAGLERISLDESLCYQRTFHQLMRRCASLSSFTWSCPQTKRYPLAPPPQSTLIIGGSMAMANTPSTASTPTVIPSEAIETLDTMPEPWGCNETIRSFEQLHGIIDKDSTDAYFSRLLEMRRLVSLGILIYDLRLILKRAHEEEQVEEQLIDGEEDYVNVDEAGDEYGNPIMHTISPHEPRRWCMPSIQELTLSTLKNLPLPRLFSNVTHYQPTAYQPDPAPHYQLKKFELQQVLNLFPRLRKIRYRGQLFPLDSTARNWLETESNRRISVLHVSQLPDSYFL